jgi:hypothetical protein
MRIYAQANLGDLAPHNNFGLGIGDLLRDDRVYRQTFRAPFDTIAQVGIRVARGSPAAVAPVRLRLATHSGEQERTIEIPADRLVDSEWTFVELPIFWNVKDVEMILDLSLVSPTRAGPRLYIHRNPSGSDADPTGMLSVCRGENCTPVTADTRTTDMAFTVLPESKPVSWPHELLGPNIAAGYGIGSAQYTGALSLPAPSILLRNLEKNGASAFVSRERHLLDRFPITHVIGRFPPHRTLIEASDDFREITVLERDNAFIRVYENMHAFPRLHFARQVRAGGTDADQQYALLRTLDGVPARETVVANMTADEKYEAGGTIETLQDTRRTMTLRTDRGTEGFLVLRDLFFPGWSAEIDKQPTSILRTDVLWRGLIVPAGVHTVTFRYRLPHEQLLWTCAIGSGSVIVAWGLCLYTQRIIHRRES